VDLKGKFQEGKKRGSTNGINEGDTNSGAKGSVKREGGKGHTLHKKNITKKGRMGGDSEAKGKKRGGVLSSKVRGRGRAQRVLATEARVDTLEIRYGKKTRGGSGGKREKHSTFRKKKNERKKIEGRKDEESMGKDRVSA